MPSPRRTTDDNPPRQLRLEAPTTLDHGHTQGIECKRAVIDGDLGTPTICIRSFAVTARHAEFLIVEDQIILQTQRTGIPIYDFDFRAFMRCRSIWHPTVDRPLVARIGALDDYSVWYSQQRQAGFRPIHSPADHARCSTLSEWYPLIAEVTPRSRVFDSKPAVEQVEADFTWPVFVKGTRQTSRHRRQLSIIQSPAKFMEALQAYEADAIMHWQPVVVREYVPLRPVEDADPKRIPSSFEFRTFWWHGRCVGAGRYWWQGKPYTWTPIEREDALRLGAIVAERLQVPFLVVDLAMTVDGRWIVIECNDGQESGYASISPLGLWSSILQQLTGE